MLCFISLALLIIRIVYPYFIEPADIVVENLPLIERQLDSAEENNSYAQKTDKHFRGKLFAFDPNKATLKELIALGFKDKTALALVNFRSKGFVFKQKEDLKKVYGISETYYAKLEPYIVIENKKAEEKTVTIAKPVAKIVELNSADSIALLEINGIGPSFAKRILKHRALLGGFVKVEQLKEVFGFNEEMYTKINKQVTVNASLVQKLDLNKDDFKTINKHPYLSYEHTKLIFDQRRIGPITKDNFENVLNDEAAYNKVLPYLGF